MHTESRNDGAQVNMQTLLRHPGASMRARDGHLVPAHYGSVATELAVCQKSVGLVDRAEMEILELNGPAVAQVEVLTNVLGTLAPGPGAVLLAGALWVARQTATQTLIVGRAPYLAARQQDLEALDLGIEVQRRSQLGCLELVGPCAHALLAGSPAQGSVATLQVAGTNVLALGLSRSRVGLLAESTSLETVWTGLLAAGRPYGIVPVGCEALERLDAAHVA